MLIIEFTGILMYWLLRTRSRVPQIDSSSRERPLEPNGAWAELWFISTRWLPAEWLWRGSSRGRTAVWGRGEAESAWCVRLKETDAAVVFVCHSMMRGMGPRRQRSLDLSFRGPEGLEKSQDATMARMESVEWGCRVSQGKEGWTPFLVWATEKWSCCAFNKDEES